MSNPWTITREQSPKPHLSQWSPTAVKRWRCTGITRYGVKTTALGSTPREAYDLWKGEHHEQSC